MNWDRIPGKWTEFKTKVHERWAKLTEADLARVAGKRDQLLNLLQERYGWVREQAERQIKDFETAAMAGAGFYSPETDDEDQESFQSR